jgi:hypothetical protein
MARSVNDSTATRIAVSRQMQVTITLAETRYSPVSYNSFGVGPFSATVTIEPGEDPAEVIEEARNVLLAAARAEYKRSIEAYPKALDYNDRVVREFMESKRGTNGS